MPPVGDDGGKEKPLTGSPESDDDNDDESGGLDGHTNEASYDCDADDGEYFVA